jgi:glycosyltransferase involved in cell wall biosynthesis
VDDLIIDGQTAVVFDPADELSIVDTLSRLLNKRDFARKIAKSAQQHLKDNHTVSRMVSDILRSYDRAQRWLRK